MMMAYGAAAMNHSAHEIVAPSCFSMKPSATMFWAAAVLIPMFQMLAAWMVATMSRAAKRLSFFILKAEMMPSTIGTMQPTRAVVLGTKNARMKPTKIMPARMRFVFAPTFERMKSAMRRSSPVCIIAAARKSAAPTSTAPLLVMPPNDMPTAFEVPSSFAGACGFGLMPRQRIISVAMMAALTG